MPKPRTKKGAGSAVELAKEVHHLADVQERRNKFSRRFYSGVVFGLGTALGASIIAAVVLYILSKIFQTIGLETMIGSELFDQISGGSMEGLPDLAEIE